MIMTAPVGFAGGFPPSMFVALGAQELNNPAGMR